eukprot:8331068-Lingulodinium_polyedra.AAC.1
MAPRRLAPPTHVAQAVGEAPAAYRDIFPLYPPVPPPGSCWRPATSAAPAAAVAAAAADPGPAAGP